MAVTTATLEQQLAAAARSVRIAPERIEASPGERVILRLEGIPDVVLAGRLIPVQATVRWTVHEAAGDRSVPAGEQFTFPRGAGVEEAELLFRPPLVDHTSPPQDAPPLGRRVRATMTLTAQPPAPDEAVTVERRLEAAVDVLPLLVPSVLALCRDPQIRGAMLAVVPSDSPFGTRSGLTAALSTLAGTVSTLSPIPGMAPLRTHLEALRGALAGSDVQFRRTDAIANLNLITLIQNGPLANDVEAEDELSSLFLLGPPERKAECYVRRNLDDGAGRLDVEVGTQGAVIVADLHRRAPSSVPEGGAEVVVAPPGNRTFGNELSSLRLVPPLLHATLEGTVTIEIDHPEAGEPTTIDVAVGLAFSPDRRSVEVESFPTIDTSDATVTQIGGGQGTFDPATGAMEIDIELNFQLKVETPFPIDRSCPITFDLTTGSDASGRYSLTGSRLDRATGRITLVSAAPFTGGHLEDTDVSLTFAGTLAPLP